MEILLQLLPFKDVIKEATSLFPKGNIPLFLLPVSVIVLIRVIDAIINSEPEEDTATSDMTKITQSDDFYIEKLKTVWKKQNHKKMMIGSDLTYTAWEVNLNNLSRCNGSKYYFHLVTLAKRGIVNQFNNPKRMAILILVISIITFVTQTTFCPYYVGKLFFQWKFSYLFWVFWTKSKFLTYGKVFDKNQHFFYMETQIDQKNKQFFDGFKGLIKQKEKSSKQLQENSCNESKLTQADDLQLLKNSQVSASEKPKKEDKAGQDPKELYKMIEALFVQVLKTSERKKVEKYLKSVSKANESTLNLVYDYTNSEHEKFEWSKMYIQNLYRVDSNDKLILLEVNNKLKLQKFWEIKLIRNEFIKFGLFLGFDDSYVSGKSNSSIISLLKDEVNCLTKAIYDSSIDEKLFLTASKNFKDQKIISIDFDIQDCHFEEKTMKNTISDTKNNNTPSVTTKNIPLTTKKKMLLWLQKKRCLN